MEKFYFEKPSINRKNEIIDFINEFKEYGSNINGVGALGKILKGLSFEEALDKTLKNEDKEYAYQNNRAPGVTYLLIRENDNKIVGSINIRHDLTPDMYQFGGHIGYSIRPAERRKGYNKINLYMGLIEADKLGLDRVMLDCDVNNVGSDKTLKALGGVLTRCDMDPNDGVLTNTYWFDVKDTIDKYRDIYEPFIYEEVVKSK